MKLIIKINNKIKYIYKKSYKKFYYLFLKLTIKRKDFTIISNNCYGGDFYEGLGLQYNTPTIGLFFLAADYLEFLSNLKYYINTELKFIDKSNKIQNIDEKSQIYPIGILDGKIEIHFLHYKDKLEAYEKWERRKKRINWDNLYIMWNDQNLFREELLPIFLNLPYKNKIFFSSKKRKGTEVIWLKPFKNQDYVPDLIPYRFKIWFYFNFAKWFNN